MTEAFARRSERGNVLAWTRRLLLAAVVAVLLVVGLVYFAQHSMLYHPRPYDARYANYLPPDGVELRFNIIAGKQVAFYLPRGSGQQLPGRIWVAFCGNGSLALDWTGLIAQDRHPGDGFLLIDYPGYGKSEGYATIASTRAAADNAIEALAKHLGATRDDVESRLCVLGHSLSYLLSENYDNREQLRELSQRLPPPRVEIFHGTNDDIIPVRMGRELAQTFPAFVRFHPIAGGDHLSPLFTATGEILATMNQ